MRTDLLRGTNFGELKGGISGGEDGEKNGYGLGVFVALKKKIIVKACKWKRTLRTQTLE